MSKLDNFIKALDDKTITDFTTYLENSPTSFREVMAERGIEVDALVAKGEPSVIEVLISNGYATEHYEKWKTHPDSRVRGELARQGYWPDFFIQDKKPDVRCSVAVAYHEYIPQILNRTESEWYGALHLIENNLDMPIEILKLFLETRESRKDVNGYDVKPIQLRYDSLAKKATLLETTMSPYDLFITHNPQWVNGVPSDVVSKILDGYHLAEKNNQMELFKAVFGKLHRANDWVEYRQIANEVGLTPY